MERPFLNLIRVSAVGIGASQSRQLFCYHWRPQAIYWGYLNLRAEKLCLPFNSPEALRESPWLGNFEHQ